MNPSLQYDLMKTRQNDLLRSAARQRVAAEARTCRQPRPERTERTAVASWRLVRRLLPS